MIVRELENMSEVPDNFDYFNDFKDTKLYLSCRIDQLKKLQAELVTRNQEYWNNKQAEFPKRVVKND